MSYIKSAHVDWYSFTTRLKSINDDAATMEDVAINSIAYVVGDEILDIVFNRDGWEAGSGRRPYKGSLWNNAGVGIHFGGQSTVLVEFTGQGCEYLRSVGALQSIIKATYERCTRIDIAVDIQASGLVNAIADSASNNRISTVGESKSPTGHTRYIGSRTSEKLVRVYEYYPPNPRAGTTRVEYEHKKKQAKITAGWVTQMPVEDVANAIGKIYEWKHEAMQYNEYVPKMVSPINENRSTAKKMQWIARQVAPAIKKMIAEGDIKNPEQWLLEMFLPDDYEPGDYNIPSPF